MCAPFNACLDNISFAFIGIVDCLHFVFYTLTKVPFVAKLTSTDVGSGTDEQIFHQN